ncbi:nucleotidyltransferase [Xenorhabdus sp. 42]|uniref:SMODS domain-containing nucleotidyltransferase n=1 Tax=Xenorhabdus szentirmaii TaxID=290112 RepID=UPI001997D4C9|nr:MULTISPECIES: nucleotidyltransferase [unclassified Xenorhabdus]MBD2791368.1 nucleotidyltransferase [Xenorhabdus sp. CUL]MBD2821758.1 nucleotidyltransferase [Xenorhabdus sp. 42]MBD2823401.1 nucleotidyltransferase [Xenorhabdus sp. 5]
MSIADIFKDFFNNLKVENAEQVSLRYGEITKSLNKKFRDSESTTANMLQVGSYGRYTGIKGISDLDMLYIMPRSKWDTYKNGKQSQLLTDVKDAIKARYPKTAVRVDHLVVTVTYQNFHVEVQPVFEKTDEDGESYFQYPDTYNGGSWKVTKPRQEMQAIKDLNDEKNKNLRLLCKMIRAWRNKHGVAMGGLLIDTLAFNFMKSTTEYDDKGYICFDWLSRDFFKYISELPAQDHYKAPGSNQNVKVKKKFQKKAKEAYELCLAAINAEGNSNVNDKWKKVYGRHFPSIKIVEESVSKALGTWRNTEECIEDMFPVDIKFNIEIDCAVHQNQGLPKSLRSMLTNGFGISNNKKLIFKIKQHDIDDYFSIRWKILNVGAEAERRDCIRGQIDVPNYDTTSRKETADFSGVHLVECYAIQNGVVVARDCIQVPIL